MKRPGLALLILSCIFFFALLVKPKSGNYSASLEGISANAIRAHMRFLSSDYLMGREPGTRGYDIAAQYMVSQFEKIGLLPAGDDSTYCQQVMLANYDLDYSGSAISVANPDGARLLSMNQDFFIYARNNVEAAMSDEEMVFTGFIADYPQKDYYPLKGAQANGKLLAGLLGAPGFAEKKQTRIFEKIEIAESLGARGIFLIATPEVLNEYSWSYILNMMGRNLEIKNEKAPRNFFAVVVHHEAARELTGFPIDTLISMAGSPDFRSFALPTKASCHISVERDETVIKSPNVIAKLQGSDPVLSNEYIVYTSHLDHVGTGWPVNGDSIYNGAYDNASGSALMLEIANAFQSLPVKPSRSILFIALTSEETGLFGSRYFVKFPTVPLQNMAANINIDMALMESPLDRAVALGLEYVNFEDMVNKTASEFEIELIPDPLPHERLYMRSDHFSFAEKGIPALFILNDLKDSANYAWFNSAYHSPDDEFNENMDFEAGAKFARLSFLIGYRLAQNPNRPEWKNNSPYRKEN